MISKHTSKISFLELYYIKNSNIEFEQWVLKSDTDRDS